MKSGCVCGFIGVCGVLAIIAQLVGIIIPKVLVLDIELHKEGNITLDKFVESVHMEVEEESSDEDDILEIESLVREDIKYMNDIEKLILKERNKDSKGTNSKTKRKHTAKRNLDSKIENVTSVQDVTSNTDTNNTKVTILENYEEDGDDTSNDNDTVAVGNTDCKYSSEETSSSSEEKEEEEEEEDRKVKEDKNDNEKEGEEDKEDDEYSSSCNETSESSEDGEEGEEETESHSVYSSISIGLWNSYICTKNESNQTECATMSFPDVLHILKKEARDFIGADFDLSMWHKVKLECIFSLVTCVLGLAFLVASVTKYFERRQQVALVFGSFGFVSSGVFTLVPVTRMMIVSVDAFNSNGEGAQTAKMGLPLSLVAFSVCGVFSMMAAFALISVTWYDRKERWRLLVRMTKQFDADIDRRLSDANIAKVYAEPGQEESVYYETHSSQSDLTKQKAYEDDSKGEDNENGKRDSKVGTRCVKETIEIELTDMGERDTFLSDLTEQKAQEDDSKGNDNKNGKWDSKVGTRCIQETVEIELTDMSERETFL